MRGTTLIRGSLTVPDPWRQGPPPSDYPWPGGPVRTFERADVVAIGKLRRWGDAVTRFVVRLADGAEFLVTGTDQSEDDRRWLAREGKAVPYRGTSRDNPWSIGWRDLREEAVR